MTQIAAKLDLAAAARRLTAAQVGLRERRRFRRMPIQVSGRLLDTFGREHDCRTEDISPGDVRIAATTLPPIGERVIIYLEGIGRVSGKVARSCGEGEVAVIFDFTAHKREKLAEQLTLIVNRDLGIEAPVRPTISDGAQLVKLEFETGEAYEGEVVDFSLAGITIKSKRPPPLIGVWVRVGTVYGRVARLIEGGFAIDFDQHKRP
ncbi:PilZ domain-containing protein [Terricaulis silvestris]|uniref:PilZ domain protein n=1 Tax=Terricaulis silvestris TaxID=2686094 RepID=A0A6I6MPQ1_9CAUL|nr:PilZ domain-containing protein [Terricaulis silvestris]QGZ94757.1 PilZ domain protein [Terricaulis silvestris]